MTLSYCIGNPDQNLLKQAYEQAQVFSGSYPSIRFDRESTASIKEAARLRQKDWKTTTRWNPLADETGLFGELAFSRYLAVPSDEVVTSFYQGLRGDRGHDMICHGETVDVKSTRGNKLLFKFSRSNRYRSQAKIIAFAFVEESPDEVWVRLLGWAYYYKLLSWVRDDERYGYRFVRWHTLERERLIQSTETLKGGECDDVEI